MADQVYITKLAKFLPNEPVSNDGMENILGRIDGQPSKSVSRFEKQRHPTRY